MASGLSMPVGFKTARMQPATAINAMRAAAQNLIVLLALTGAGQVALLQTRGNPHGHVILRGGKAPNYSPADAQCEKADGTGGTTRPSLMADCSHGNPIKIIAASQPLPNLWLRRLRCINRSIIGLMIEK